MTTIVRGLVLCLLICSRSLVAGTNAEPPDSLYRSHCAACHDHAETHAPSILALQQMPLSRISMALEFGKMQLQGAALSPEQRQTLALWLAQADDAERDRWIEARRCTAEPGELRLNGNENWGFGLRNARYIRNGVAIDRHNIASLKLAWALAIPQATDMRSQPVAAGELLFLGTQHGNLLALDKASGCVHWNYQARGAIRSALTLAASADSPTLFFADDLGTVYAVDARHGTLRWQTSLRLFQTSVISGSLSYYDGQLFVPVSSFEVAVAGMPTYPCCRSHGAVVALDARSGKTQWRFDTTADAQPTHLNSAGVQMWGPSGASVWSTPTIDAKRGLVYVGSGENFSHPQTSTSDAVLALDMRDGRLRWQFQALANDVWNGACQLQGPNCPENPGPDWDIGASVILTRTPLGRDVLLVGQKSGEAFALDPDQQGKLLWRRRLSQGTANGGNSGIHWGMASDGSVVYAPVSDPDWKLPGYTPRPGVYALRVKDGSMLWEHPVQRGCTFNAADAPMPGLAQMRQANAAALSPWPDCSYFYAHSAAAVLAGGVVYAGALDGKLRALDARNGKELRVFETARSLRGDNGVEGHGGSIDVGGVVPSGRYLFVVSGYSMFGQMPGNLLLAYTLPSSDK